MRVIAELKLLKNERMARWSYNQLVLRQPQFSVQGLYRFGDRYAILANENPDLAMSLDGRKIKDWFAANKAITCWIEIVTTIGGGYRKVSDLTIREISGGAGEPLNLNQLTYWISLCLSGNDSDFLVEDIAESKTIRITLSKSIGFQRTRKIKKVLRSFQYPAIYQIAIEASTSGTYHPPAQGIELWPSRILYKKLGKSLSRIAMEDEDFWFHKKQEIYENPRLRISDLVPYIWSQKGELSGLVNATVRKYDNLRNFFTLYDSLIIAPPLRDFHDSFFSGIGVSETEFLKLFELGKIKIIVPQDLSRYNIDFLSRLADSGENNLILSRRLAACGVIDARNRFPLLYPTFGMEGRSGFLSVLSEAFRSYSDSVVQNWGMAMIESLAENYLGSNYHLDHKGAMGLSVTGIANLFSKTFKAVTGRDTAIEAYSAGNFVEWASPFQSVIISPKSESDFDESSNIEIMANFFSAVKRAPLGSIELRNKIVESVLTIDDDVDILDLAKSFQGKDVRNFRNLVADIENANDTVQLEERLRMFNKEVSQFEKRRERLRSIDISGLIGAVGGVAGSVVTISTPAAGIPIAALSVLLWFEKLLYSRRNGSRIASNLYDSLDKAFHRSHSNVVLVSRLREAVNR